MVFTVICLCFSPGHAFAQSKGPPTEMIKGAYQEILKGLRYQQGRQAHHAGMHGDVE